MLRMKMWGRSLARRAALTAGPISAHRWCATTSPPLSPKPQASMDDTNAAINAVAAAAGFRCVPVSWEDAQRTNYGSGGAGGLSCFGPNIADVRLYEKTGRQLYTLRSENWNERLGYVASRDVTLVTGNESGATVQTAVTLEEYLRSIGRYGSYAGLQCESLYAAEVDDIFSIRFQAVFLPLATADDGGRAATEFCTEVYSYNTRVATEPRNMLLLATPQGTSMQQDGPTSQRLYFHSVDPAAAEGSGGAQRYWLEAEQSTHGVGGEQAETREEALEAAGRGKATAVRIGPAALGSRFNVQMLIQVPLQVKPPPPLQYSSTSWSTYNVGGAFGIKLGSSGLCSAVWKNDVTNIIPDALGRRVTPAWVAFTPTETLVGEAARQQFAHNPSNTITNVRPLLGRSVGDICDAAAQLPYKVVCAADDAPAIEVVGAAGTEDQSRRFTPIEVSAMLLKEAKKAAEVRHSKPVTRVVLTVPAYFTDSQRQATRDAATLAELDVMRVINEPTAAAIAYGLDRLDCDLRNVVILDIGGTSLDATALEIDGGIFELKATLHDGSHRVCGDAFDERLAQHLATEFNRAHSDVDVRAHPRAMYRLRVAAENAKRALSTAVQTTVDIDGLCEGHDLQITLSRARFELLCGDLFRASLEQIDRVLRDAQLRKEDVHDVVMAGGSFCIPKLKQLVSNYFNGTGATMRTSIAPDEVIARGAAIQAYILTGGKSKQTEGLLLLDIDYLMQLKNGPAPAAAPVVGVSNAARVSRGSLHDVYGGLPQPNPKRDTKMHGTITVSMYYTVVGGVPSVEDVQRCVSDLEALYKAMPSDKRLVNCAEVTFNPNAADSPPPSVKGVCCPSGHVLYRHTVQGVAAAQAALMPSAIGKYSCRVCGKLAPTNGVAESQGYGCRLCQFDLCLRCHDTHRTCAHNAALMLRPAIDGGKERHCALCGHAYGPSGLMFGCPCTNLTPAQQDDSALVCVGCLSVTEP